MMNMYLKPISTNIALLLICIFVFISCHEQKTKTAENVLPVLRMEIISIPVEGFIGEIEGNILIKKKNQNRYVRINQNDNVTCGDILEIKKGGKIELKFNDGTSKQISSLDKDTWVTFECSNR